MAGQLLKQKRPFSPYCHRLWVPIRRTLDDRRTLAVRFLFLSMSTEVQTITELMINEQIRDREVRLIDADGAQLGIVQGKDAQRLADEKKLDLVKISPTANPPVCKIMDYSKFRFEQQKKEKEARKKQKTVDIKELRLSQNIDVHDVNVKIKKCIEFLKSGAKVKITIRFRGRELSHTNMAHTILNKFAEDVAEYGVVEKPPKLEARTLAMFLAPKA